jgi:hypothetical protein
MRVWTELRLLAGNVRRTRVTVVVFRNLKRTWRGVYRCAHHNLPKDVRVALRG